MAASDVGLQLRPALETAVVAGLILLLAALAVENFKALIAYSEITEAFSLAAPVKLDLVEYRALHGEWPISATELPATGYPDSGQRVTGIDLRENGAFSISFGANAGEIAGRRLTFRPAYYSDSAATISWHCGGRLPREPLRVFAADATDIESAHLPPICQEQQSHAR